ncbi:MAG: RHS repeat-associated core domain-containing protein [Rhizobiaceae bacterium]
MLSTGLGSASALVTGGGQKVNETRYLPFGGYRSGGPNALTDRGFTGQKENMELGLLYYNARFYAPGLGRFLSADTIVPNPANPQSLNRYSYVLNRPLGFTDPSGHNPICNQAGTICSDTDSRMLVNFTVRSGVGEKWTLHEMLAILKGANDVDSALKERNSSFFEVYGGTVTFHKTGTDGCPDKVCYGEWAGNNQINVYTDIYNKDDQGNFTTSKIPAEWAGHRWAVHELGHGFEAHVNTALGDTNHIRDNLPANVANREGFAGSFPGWQQSECAIACNGEIFADMFVGAIYGQWDTGEYLSEGIAKANYMTTNMSTWISAVSP